MKKFLPFFFLLLSLQIIRADNAIVGLSVKEKKDLLCVSISGSLPKDYKLLELTSPFRIVIDFPSTVYKGATLVEKPSCYPIKEIRLSQFKESPPIARVVIEMEERTPYQIIKEGGAFKLLIKKKEKPLKNSSQKGGNGQFIPVLPALSSIPISRSDNKPSDKFGEKYSDPGDLISIDFLKTDIRDVFKSLTMQTGINFFLTPEVKGEVTLSADKIKVEDAIELICKLNNLEFKKEKEGYVIATPQEMERLYPIRKETITFLLKNAKPSDIQPILEKAFPKGSFQAVGNTIVADLPEAEVEKCKKLIADLDTAQAPSPKEKEITEVVKLSYLDVDDAIEMLKTLYPDVKAAKAPSQAFTAFAAMAGAYGMGGYGAGGYGAGGYGAGGYGGLGG
ncbi:MAG: AMIN domain-containing protein, partial [bacterium]